MSQNKQSGYWFKMWSSFLSFKNYLHQNLSLRTRIQLYIVLIFLIPYISIKYMGLGWAWSKLLDILLEITERLN